MPAVDQNSRPDVVMVMVPLPAQGHLNQLLHLSCLVSSHAIPVHYVASATHIRQATSRLHGWDPRVTSNIHLHSLPSPPFSSPTPDPAAKHKFPSHLQPSMEASISHLRAPIASLVSTLSASTRRVAVVYDSLMASTVQDAAALPNAETYTFESTSVFTILAFQLKYFGRQPWPEFEAYAHHFPTMEDCFPPEFIRFAKYQHEFLNLSSGKLYNTCPAMEAPFIDRLKEEIDAKPFWAVGPFNPVKPISSGRHRSLEWLDKHPEGSVIYVSFGTTTAMTAEQIGQLAAGLERSGQRFLWVLRVADRSDVFTASGTDKKDASLTLPAGYEERVEGVGLVLTGEWAPQLEILGHSAVGGFMSHCGWNSCVESLGMGVPLAAWPMHSDQPGNAVLAVEHLKVGLAVREWGRREETVSADAVERAVRRLMASEDGAEMRRRAAELGGDIRKSVAKGGDSAVALGEFIAHIARA